MYWNFKQIIKTLSRGDNYRLLAGCRHGLERECLRITKKGKLATTPHPKNLGSALTNPYITTDFSESQLELVTPTFDREEDTLKFLEDIHLFVNKNLSNELLWPFSMPCRLPSEKKIPLANYGKSYTGKKKTLYRLGLSHRYGRKMQTVSGTHYNFSFSDKFWNFLHKNFTPKEEKSQFISAAYLALIRNFLRHGWLNTYLFGASPVLDKSYLNKKHQVLKKCDWRSCYGNYATSFRMSELGYYSKIQKQLAISFNNLDDYISDLKRAISTPDPAYKGLPGLNENILQIENEHYSRIRPKQTLAARGIKYVEVRAVDINPFSPIGLTIDQLHFLHVFMVYCLFKPSPFLTLKEQHSLTENQNKVAFYGRDPGLSLKGEAQKLLLEMSVITNLMDKNFSTPRYNNSLNMQMDKLADPGLTPSAIILEEMKKRKKSFIKFGLQLAQENKKLLSEKTLAKSLEDKFAHVTRKSLKDQENLEIKEETLLPEHEDMEVSTQILIKEAKNRGIDVEILDRKENFIRLKKRRKEEYVKQATKTSKDSYITYLIMENKHVSKYVLTQSGIKVPQGKLFSNIDDALNSYKGFENKKVAVKPNLTNFGIGISFVKPHNPEKFKTAVKEAFKHGKSILVEEFITGNEYRFLVIDYKTVSILNRIPANITGDGIHNIKQLIAIKNEDPHYYKFFNDYYLRLGKVEAEHLRSQNLTFKSIPKKGCQIFLRTNSNVSTGGDPIDVTSEIPKKYKIISEIAARAVNARICGIDMIIEDSAKVLDTRRQKNFDRSPAMDGRGSKFFDNAIDSTFAESSISENFGHQAGYANHADYAIIEINFNPALQMHEYPVKGKRCKVADKVLDLLGF